MDERSDWKALKLARMRLETSPIISNPHKNKNDSMNLLVDTIKHENPPK
jgi:hypothetical protein